MRRLALLVLFVATPAWASDGWLFARRQLGKIDGKSRWVLVTDLDYTALDPRPRTQAAARAFGLGRVPLRKIGWDGRETAKNLGLDDATAERFQSFWEGVFWNPDNLHRDKALVTARLLRRAKLLGAEIVYLTGRNTDLGPKTADRLRDLGFPDPDNVVAKQEGEDTAAFKVRWMREARAQGKKILFYMTDSYHEIRAFRAARMRLPLLYVRGLVTHPKERGLKSRLPQVRGRVGR